MADPVADFLAREQELFAEIDGGNAPANPPAQGAPADFGDEFGQMAAAEPPSIPNNDSGVDLATADVLAPAFALADAPVGQQNGGGSERTSPAPRAAMTKEVAENIKRWQEEQKVMLAAKDAEEEKTKDEWRKKAKDELVDWYKKREQQLKELKQANEKAEKQHAADGDRGQSVDAAWDEVAALCDAKPKGCSRDVSRMKALLVHLKEQQTGKN
ncbi:unnamed protein product, partial [Mesorhabditis spiculigera]